MNLPADPVTGPQHTRDKPPCGDPTRTVDSMLTSTSETGATL